MVDRKDLDNNPSSRPDILESVIRIAQAVDAAEHGGLNADRFGSRVLLPNRHPFSEAAKVQMQWCGETFLKDYRAAEEEDEYIQEMYGQGGEK